jgi:hypothetical protein
MSGEDAAWAALFAVGAGYEAYAIWRKEFDRTASRTTRRWFRTHHPLGAAVFAVGWGSFAVWFTWHIIKGSNGQVPYAESE